ncbi:DUF6284 family protein [Phytohabitans aurantiacus]|uniref:DUF222 domain-containing protein n=1 Tax=Phytohabitans aurantiacus TaxID=3016789 RepID=A0ABQ5QSC0_9ACTN|nr:DUF6284 family protein [Phytohabitans aurantiacus]GLH97142.1 hypothetical protein Pa4123_24170 [Phytohabitans aurantiacus]
MDRFGAGSAEPTGDDLVAIEAEWPVIEAEIDLVDAEARLAAADHPSELDWRALRRAEARVLRVAAEFYARPARAVGSTVRQVA